MAESKEEKKVPKKPWWSRALEALGNAIGQAKFGQ